MKWPCKICSSVLPKKGDLLKHYRLHHDSLGRHKSQPCLYSDCPCSFKTLSALRSHLSRQHSSVDSETRETLSFSCQNCGSSRFSTESDFFAHLGRHLKCLETVHCVFNHCDFQTNVYGTFAAHKSRKHTPHTVTDFKPVVLQRNIKPVHFDLSNTIQNEESEDTNYFPVVKEKDASPNPALRKIGLVLLKLETTFHVSSKCVDQLVEDIQFISAVASVDTIKDIIENTLQKHNCIVDTSLITDLTKELCECSLLSTALGADGPFSTSYKRREYFKENFSVVEPVEYIVDAKEKRTFQYVPILKSLSQLLNNNDILHRAVEGFTASQSSIIPQFKSYCDGTYFRQNEFLSGGEFKISLILYIDDFETCNPLGTARKKYKTTAVYWTLGNIPSQLRSELTSIYLAVLGKADDVKRFGYGSLL